MLSVKIDTIQFNKIMNNVVQYSNGFVEGINLSKLEFNRFLGGYTAEALNKFIDAKARMGNDLHHVYEPGNAGNPKSRLFKFEVIATQSNIAFKGNFLPSKGIPVNGGSPLIDRANIMENGISITITPRSSNVLVFEDENQTVFTADSIVIEHPGGDGVAGSFGHVVEEFFDIYFRNSLLGPILADLSTADEFVRNFSSGAAGGRSVGVRAGRQYLNASGLTIE